MSAADRGERPWAGGGGEGWPGDEAVEDLCRALAGILSRSLPPGTDADADADADAGDSPAGEGAGGDAR